MTIKEMYQYVYYKIYKSFSNSVFDAWSEWRASGILAIIEIFFIFSLLNYYQIFINRYFVLPGNTIIWVLFLVLILGYLIYISFHHTDQWQPIVKKFDAWPKRKNQWGTFIVWFIILLIILNLGFSFYLASQIDWTLYR